MAKTKVIYILILLAGMILVSTAIAQENLTSAVEDGIFVRIDGLSAGEIEQALLGAGESPDVIAQLNLTAIAAYANRDRQNFSSLPSVTSSPAGDSVYKSLSCSTNELAATLLDARGTFNTIFAAVYVPTGTNAQFAKASTCGGTCTYYHSAGDTDYRIKSHSGQSTDYLAYNQTAYCTGVTA